jgi:polysaccharide biosynthesis/export protein
MKLTYHFWCCILLFGLFAGCKSNEPTHAKLINPSVTHQVVANKVNPDLLTPPRDFFTLGPGDQIEVDILGNATSRASATVGLDGKIYYSFLPGIDVWGMTLAQAKGAIENELSKYISQPQVAVTLRAVGSKYVWLLGRLNKPGVYPMAGSMTLLESISMAGGTGQSTSTVTTEELADLRHSFVAREGKLLPVDFYKLLKEGDMSQNIYLKPDDFVFVPSALSQEVYVLGAVLAPKSVSYTDQMTLISAISAANGTIPNAYLSHVAIVRGSLNSPEIMIVDYGAVVRGAAPNVRLEPHDIVYVPLSPYRVLSRYLDLIASTFVRTLAANEGVNAVSSRGAAVGVSVPVGVNY